MLCAIVSFVLGFWFGICIMCIFFVGSARRGEFLDDER